MSEDKENLTPEEKLKQENLLLKSKIILRGGDFGNSSEIDPALENQFLENIITFEDAPQIPTYIALSIEPSDFPPADKLTEEELKQKFDFLIKILEENNFAFDIADRLPLAIAYKYLTKEFLLETTTMLPEGWTHHIDGCSGDCPSCFQVDYCKSALEIWSKEELEAERKKRREEDTDI